MIGQLFLLRCTRLTWAKAIWQKRWQRWCPSKYALAKIENKTEEQQPSTPTGGFRGWPSSTGPRPPLFLWNFVLLLKNSQKNKKYLYSWQVFRPSPSEFSGSTPASSFTSSRSFANALERDLKQVYSSYIYYRLSVFWKDVLIFECLLLLLLNKNWFFTLTGDHFLPSREEAIDYKLL